MSELGSRGAGTAVMFFAFFSLMLLVAAGIFWGVNLFYGRGHDFREAEAFLMEQKVDECLRSGKNIYDFFAEDFDFYKICEFSKKIVEDGKHFVLLKAKDDSYKKIWGVADFENTCQFTGRKGNIDFPGCFENIFVNVDGKEFIVIAGSSQHSRRANLG